MGLDKHDSHGGKQFYVKEIELSHNSLTVDDEDAGKSFLRHMVGKDRASLTNYANLIYAGLAEVPVPKSRVEEFMDDLLPYVSKCKVCEEPVASKAVTCTCPGCNDLYFDILVKTTQALERHRRTRFYSVDLWADVHKKPRRDEEVA